MTSERHRIAFLLARDGAPSTGQWVERTCRLYREALASKASHASIPEYRPLFEDAVREFDEWLATQEPDQGAGTMDPDRKAGGNPIER